MKFRVNLFFAFIALIFFIGCSKEQEQLPDIDKNKQKITESQIIEAYNVLKGETNLRSSETLSADKYFLLAEGVLNYQYGNAQASFQNYQFLRDTLTLSHKGDFTYDDLKSFRNQVVKGIKARKQELKINADDIRYINIAKHGSGETMLIEVEAMAIESAPKIRSTPTIPQFTNNEHLHGIWGSCDNDEEQTEGTFKKVEQKINQYYNQVNTLPSGSYFYNITQGFYYSTSDSGYFSSMWDFTCPDQPEIDYIEECACNSPSYLHLCHCSLYMDQYHPTNTSLWIYNSYGQNQLCLTQDELNQNVQIAVDDMMSWGNELGKTPISIYMEDGSVYCFSPNKGWQTHPTCGDLFGGGVLQGGELF